MTPLPPSTLQPRTAPGNELAGAKLGNYRLERIIGRGRMGVVYLARDEALLRPTAIKVLAWDPEDARGQDPLQWFLSEARLVARINDPRVVQIYGAARQGAWCYIAMEYVPGQSAEALLAQGSRLKPDAATDLLAQAASALAAAHRSGVVHRDVKPGNLLLGPGGVTKLSDFGMALGAAGTRAGTAHVRAGTPFYTAPEVWRGGVAGPASDIYSLGATYFHLLTGRPPFPAVELAAVEQAHLGAPPPDPRALVPGLPASCAALVARALAKSPAERHASAQELMWDARRVLQDLAAAGHPLDPSAPAPSPGADGGAAAPLPAPADPAGAPGAPPPRSNATSAVALPPATGPLVELGFVLRPFGPVDPAHPPFRAEPLATAGRRLEEALADPVAGPGVVVVTGPRGGGVSTLLRRAALSARASRLVLALDVRAAQDGRTLLQRLGALAGLSDSGPDAVDGLLLWLADERRQRRAPPLVVLTRAEVPHPTTTGLSALVQGALATRAATLLVGGPPGLAGALARAGVDFRGRPPVEIAVPPLDADQVAHYVRAWLAATRPATAAPVIFSPDALLLLAHRSAGVLERIDRLAGNMLVLAAAGRTRGRGAATVTTWHAWAASDRERWADGPAAPAVPPRPSPWPTPEAARVIDACRREAGLPPRPAAGGGRGGP